MDMAPQPRHPGAGNETRGGLRGLPDLSPDMATHPSDPTEPQLTNPSLCTSTTTTGTRSTTSQTTCPDGQPCLPSMETKLCFRCHQPGHQARSCPSAMECDVATCNLASEAGKRGENGWEVPRMINVILGNVKTQALVDTGLNTM
ncbi:UNVERIFIED_CONTAM: hypothetical protein FKN15_065425 [Acipenser sinensis]